MLTSLIPKQAKARLKQRIKNTAFETSTLKYIPYEYGADWYLIPKHPSPGYATCDQGLPIPPNALWLGPGAKTEDYLSGGRVDVSRMLALATASGFSVAEAGRILDFGCGSGRMIRHLKCFSDSSEIWGTDISAPHIYWAKQYLSPPFRFTVTTTVPHLPFEDRFFDFIYCGSVFTHIDDLADAWLCELRRILALEGRLYLTIHDGHTIELLNGPYRDASWLAAGTRAHEIYKISKDVLGMLVIGRGPESQVFYDAEYFCETLASLGFRVLSVTEEALGYQPDAPVRCPALQTAVLVERR